MYKKRLGREVWLDMHCMVARGEDATELIHLLRQHYPCIECRRNIPQHIEHLDFQQNSIDIMYQLHNCVNQMLHKRTAPRCILQQYVPPKYNTRYAHIKTKAAYVDRLKELDTWCQQPLTIVYK